MSLPATAHQLYAWNASLLAIYAVFAWILDGIYKATSKGASSAALRPADFLFNGATFSASCLIALGIYDDGVLKLIGDTTGYLILAGMAGMGYSLLALLPKKHPLIPSTPQVSVPAHTP